MKMKMNRTPDSSTPELTRRQFLGKAAKGAMLWKVDNGPAQEALRAGVKLT